MKIHFESDLHLEMNPTLEPDTVNSDVYICAGDLSPLYNASNINRVKQFLIRKKEIAKHVIWILGNHEFYHMDYNNTLKVAKDLANELDINLMDEAINTDNLEIDGVTFWGSTFWSNLENNDPLISFSASQNINDFFLIQNGNRLFSTDNMVDINKRSRTKINWDADVVITHFPPILVKHPNFPVSNISYYFCNTKLDQRIVDSNIKYWLCGHTHNSFNIKYINTTIISNQLGYQGIYHKEISRYQSNFIIDL